MVFYWWNVQGWNVLDQEIGSIDSGPTMRPALPTRGSVFAKNNQASKHATVLFEHEMGAGRIRQSGQNQGADHINYLLLAHLSNASSEDIGHAYSDIYTVIRRYAYRFLQSLQLPIRNRCNGVFPSYVHRYLRCVDRPQKYPKTISLYPDTMGLGAANPCKKKEKGPTGPYPDDQLGPIIDPKRDESKVGPEKLARCRWGGAHVVSRRLSDVMRANPGLEVRCAVCYYVVVPTSRIIYAIGVGEGPLNKWPEHLDLSLSGCQDLAKPQLAHSTSMSDAMRRADTVNCSMAGAWRLGSNAIAPTVNER